MPKALIDGVWTDINVPVIDNGEYLAKKSELAELRERKAAVKKAADELLSSLAKTSHSSLSRVKHFQNSSYYSTQGGCIDDTYIYVYLRKSGTVSTSTTGALVKLKRSDYSIVKTVTGLKLYNGNDICYNSKTGYLYAATMYQSNDLTRIDVIDRSTLAVVESKTIPFYISGISYEPSRDVFIGAYGGITMYVFKLDESGEFTLVKKLSNLTSPAYLHGGYSSQGITCDGAFIYHSWSYAPAWRIEIYDWRGKYHGCISGSTSEREIEWIEKTGINSFITGMHTIGGGGYCTIYTFTTS